MGKWASSHIRRPGQHSKGRPRQSIATRRHQYSMFNPFNLFNRHNLLLSNYHRGAWKCFTATNAARARDPVNAFVASVAHNFPSAESRQNALLILSALSLDTRRRQ